MSPSDHRGATIGFIDNADVHIDAVLQLIEEEAARISAQDKPSGLEFAPPAIAAARTTASALEKKQRATQSYETWRKQKDNERRAIAAKRAEEVRS